MIFHSSIEPIYYILPIVGLVIGLFGTVLGGGGGFFFLPILALVLRVPTQTAVITSLVATLPICVVGSLGHYRKGNIDLKSGSIFIVVGIAGAFIGAAITNIITAEQLKSGYGIYSLLIAFNMIIGTWKKKSEEGNQLSLKQTKYKKITKGSFFGLFAGLITGTFGTSGTAPVLAGLFSMRIPLKMVIGTSLMVVLVNTLFAVSAHFIMGRIDLTLVYFLTSGSLVGSLIGPGLLAKVKTVNSENRVRYMYALVMIIIGVLMLIK
ncbi:MAG: sulfite exporter TauE/SafE family protein [Bacteroidales bacterium]|jgi:uncharacterized membrane protein YfcA|nr:sulfite exporter TauE/SafE family protein [Bacteroidales bacterium]